MIKDLMKLKKQIDTMIETYKDLHPDDYELMDNGEYLTKVEYGEGIGSTIGIASMTDEEYEKQEALKKIREGTYESTFSEKQREKATKSSEGSPSLCVYGDT